MEPLLAITIGIVIGLLIGFFWHDNRIAKIKERVDLLNRYINILVKDDDEFTSKIRNLEAKVSDQKEIISKLRDSVNKLAFSYKFSKK